MKEWINRGEAFQVALMIHEGEMGKWTKGMKAAKYYRNNMAENNIGILHKN
jgi:hypothetical protein